MRKLCERPLAVFEGIVRYSTFLAWVRTGKLSFRESDFRTLGAALDSREEAALKYTRTTIFSATG